MRILAAVISLSRFVFGVVFIANPKIMDQAWIGKQARLPGPQLLSRAVGARDLTLGAGGVQAAVRNDGSARQWLAAAAVCDAVDFGATYAAGRGIPRTRAHVGARASRPAAAVLSLIAAAGTGKRRHEEPLQPAHDITEAGAVPSRAGRHRASDARKGASLDLGSPKNVEIVRLAYRRGTNAELIETPPRVLAGDDFRFHMRPGWRRAPCLPLRRRCRRSGADLG